jgi:dephospho-CoA kinase
MMVQHVHSIPRLGITGGIGSGKSTALEYLRQLGAAVMSSDEIVHGLYEHPDVVAAVKVRFGDDVVRNGVIDRGALAQVVFADPDDLAWLENRLHPEVRRIVGEWAAQQEKVKARPRLLAVEVPLLFEAGFEPDFDVTMAITAPAEVRRRRLASRFATEDLEARLSRQMPDEEKAARADLVYDNSGAPSGLEEFLRDSVASIIAAWDAPRGQETTA